jgi:hypothetical protein
MYFGGNVRREFKRNRRLKANGLPLCLLIGLLNWGANKKTLGIKIFMFFNTVIKGANNINQSYITAMIHHIYLPILTYVYL